MTVALLTEISKYTALSMLGISLISFIVIACDRDWGATLFFISALIYCGVALAILGFGMALQ